MKLKVYIKKRSTDIYAEALYDGGIITVLPGGKISESFTSHIRGGRIAKEARSNGELVDADRNIIKHCVFNSPTIAAQFVTGVSTNGHEAWKIDKKTSLGDYLKSKGLKEDTRRGRCQRGFGKNNTGSMSEV